MAGQDRKIKCATKIPHEWPQFTGPASTGNVSTDRSAWNNFLREMRKLGPTPKVY